MISIFTNLLRNEQLQYGFDEELQPEKAMKRIHFFRNFNVLKLSEDNLQVSIMDNEFARSTLKYGAHLVIPLIDTYLVVLLSIDQICGKNIVLNLKTLIKELHIAFKTLYTEEQMIPYLSSCIKELSKTAIDRYIEMGFLTRQNYLGNTGSNTSYISSPS